MLSVFPQTLELGPGTVRESLLSASMRACYVPWRGPQLRFDVCSEDFIGLVTATGRGYVQSATHSQPWLAAPVEVAMAGLSPDRSAWSSAGADSLRSAS